MTADFKDRVVVISGCGRGQGLMHMRYFAERGAAVCGFDLFGASSTPGDLQYPMADERDLDVATRCAADSSATAMVEAVDMNRYDQLEKFASGVRRRFLNIDLLVCNAAVQYVGEVVEASAEVIDTVVATNIAGTIKTVKALAPLFRSDRGGSVVLIGSATSECCPSGQALYGATKGALAALARGLAVELGPKRVRVNAIMPSYVITSERSALSGSFPIDDTTFYEGYPLAGVRGIPAEQISAVVAFLGSEQAAHISGANIRVDAGKLSLA